MIRRIAKSAIAAAIDTFVSSLPDRPRFVATQVWRGDLSRRVSRATKGQHGEYRWTCPDPNFEWHLGVDDCGWSETWLGAYTDLLKHWGLHHVEWSEFAQDHDAWDDASKGGLV